MKYNLKSVVYTTILVAAAIVIDLLVSVIPGLNLSMPMGGKLFGISLIPLILIGLMFGIKYGLLASFIYALYNFSFDYLIYISTLAYLFSLKPIVIIGIVFLDYLIPFTAIGLSGLFKKEKLTNKTITYSLILVSLLRLLSSTLSGFLLWGSGIKDVVASNDSNYQFVINIFRFVNNNLFLYSLVYNFIYIATTFISVLIILILIKNSLNTIIEKTNQENTYQ